MMFRYTTGAIAALADSDAKQKKLGVKDELKDVPGVTTQMLIAFSDRIAYYDFTDPALAPQAIWGSACRRSAVSFLFYRRRCWSACCSRRIAGWSPPFRPLNFRSRPGHEPLGLTLGAPGLRGQQRAYLEQQLRAFKGSNRRNDISEQMRSVARQLTSEEIAMLAAYYSNIVGITGQ
jgi:hypothetical protein